MKYYIIYFMRASALIFFRGKTSSKVGLVVRFAGFFESTSAENKYN